MTSTSTMGTVEARFSGFLLLLATLWLGIILWAPYARSQSWISAEPIYYSFRLICHQLAERSFSYFGNSLPVCQRCSGLYLGA